MICAQAVANSFDGIIDTVSAQHDISQLLPLLKVHPPAFLGSTGILFLLSQCVCL